MFNSFFRDTFAFCTEPVFASLANIFTQKDSSVQSHLQDFSFLEIEIRHGLFQVFNFFLV